MDIVEDDSQSQSQGAPSAASRAVAESPFDDGKADVVLLSSDNVLFYVHKLLLSLVSPVFETMFSLAYQETQELHEGRPCIAVADESQALLQVLSWCDPRCSPRSTEVQDLLVVLEIADKYGMDTIISRVETFILSMGSRTISTNPLAIFAVGVRFRREGLIRAAAKESLKVPLAEWKITPEMKHISAFTLQSLLQYWHKCVEVAKLVPADLEWCDRDEAPWIYISTACGMIEECVTVERGGEDWLQWGLDYIDLARQALEKSPSSSRVENPLVLAEVSTKISNGSCPNCRTSGHRWLNEISKALSDEIEKRMEEVPFDCQY